MICIYILLYIYTYHIIYNTYIQLYTYIHGSDSPTNNKPCFSVSKHRFRSLERSVPRLCMGIQPSTKVLKPIVLVIIMAVVVVVVVIVVCYYN